MNRKVLALLILVSCIAVDSFGQSTKSRIRAFSRTIDVKGQIESTTTIPKLLLIDTSAGEANREIKLDAGNLYIQTATAANDTGVTINAAFDITTVGDGNFKGGQVEVGVNDTTRGLMQLYGNATTTSGALAIHKGGTDSGPSAININSSDGIVLNITAADSNDLTLKLENTGAKNFGIDVRGAAVFNEDSADVDFRVEGDGEVNLFFVDASVDSIGIGTSSPDSNTPLHIVVPAGQGNGVLVENVDPTNPEVYYALQTTVTGSNAWRMGINQDNKLSFTFENQAGQMTGTGTKLLIDTSGNVGIGTTSPDANLEIEVAGEVTFKLTDKTAVESTTLTQKAADGNFGISRLGTGSEDFAIQADGDVIVTPGAGDNFGVGTTSPSAKAHIVEDATDQEVLRLETISAGDDPNYYVIQGRVLTTDATVTTINTITIAASNTYLIEARIVARRTGGSAGTAEDGAAYVIRAAYKGGPFIIGSIDAAFTAEDQAAWDVTLSISPPDVLVRVTGTANNNITWHSTVTISNVGS